MTPGDISILRLCYLLCLPALDKEHLEFSLKRRSWQHLIKCQLWPQEPLPVNRFSVGEQYRNEVQNTFIWPVNSTDAFDHFLFLMVTTW